MADKKNAQVQVVAQMTESIVRLHKLGGLSLVMIGGVLIIFVLILAYSVFDPQAVKTLGEAIPLLYNFLIVFGLVGAAIRAGEHYLEYRLTSRQMEMLAKVTENLVQAGISGDHRLDTSQIKTIADAVFENVWKYSTPNKT